MFIHIIFKINKEFKECHSFGLRRDMGTMELMIEKWKLIMIHKNVRLSIKAKFIHGKLIFFFLNPNEKKIFKYKNITFKKE